jgi:tetratricopeptide (TPR) repeat protein
MSEHWERLQEIFDEICGLDEDSRRLKLDQYCNGDDSLRGEAERLVRAYDEERAINAEARNAPAGRRFGVWETIRMLARGGMGEVWLARRADGQHEQQAALKILSPYLAAPDSLDRFRRERQLLARLEHPNIARLLDGGMSPRGEPYLVMEYVDGVRLDRYSDQHHLSIRERLRLMIKVCAAVNSAHQYLVVHRDLKPGNILVAEDGEPKLLDFGIAKMIDVEAGLEQTATTNLFLTPMYASPEILRGEPASVASDVYSLGVVLYELLSGRRPFDVSKLGPAGLVEAVTQSDAARPSDAVRLGAPQDIAKLRTTTPEKLKAALDGDLDSIVLKALAKNPEDRYGTAAQLAEDLRRHMQGEPVSAVQGGWYYVARKFVRRNRLAVSAAAIVLVSLIAGLGGTLWQAHIARQERANAEQRFNDARRLVNYLLFELYDSVGNVPGTMPVQAEMAHRALDYLDRLAALKTNDPALRLELGEGYLRLGTLFGRRLGLGDTLGDNVKALESYRKALAVVEPLAREHPENEAARRTLGTIDEQLGGSLSITGQYAEAFSRLQQSAEIFEKLAMAHPRDLRSLQDSGTAWQTFGKQLSEKSGYIAFNAEKPLAYLNRSVSELEAALGIDPGNPQTIKLLAATYESIGRIESMPNPKVGVEAYSTALTLLARLPGNLQTSVDVRQLRAMMLVHSGWNQGQLGDLKTAITNLDAGRSVLDELAAADPENAAAAFRRVDAYRSLGLVHGYAGHPAEALENLRTAVEILDVIVKRDSTNRVYSVIRAELQGRVANLLLKAGRRDEARPYAEASVGYFKKMGESPDATPGQLIEAVRSVAETGIESLRDYPAALRFALHADELAKGKNPAALGYLAEAYALNDKFPEAAEAARKGVALTPAPKPGEAASQLYSWLQGEVKEYEGKAKTGK